MIVRTWWRNAGVLACMALALVVGNAVAQEIPLVNGEHWTRSTPEVKKAYLVGIANFVQLESAYSASNPPSDAQSVIPRLVKGLRGQTLDSVRDFVDRWYAAHPDRLQRPVLETVWFEMVAPALGKSS
jgi:hypothetical protein